MTNSACRNSNIELCRLFAIFGVLLIHSIYASLGYPDSPSDTHIPLILGESFGIIGVNVFVLISGYFSIKPTRRKFLYILYACLFYAILRIVVGFLIGKVSFRHLLFVTQSNWFVYTYLALMCIAPLLNMLVENVNKNKLGGVVVISLCMEFYFDFIFSKRYLGFNGGYSLLSFSILYLIGRYIKLHGLQDWITKYSVNIYFICSLVLSLAIYLVICRGVNVRGYVGLLYKYDNPLIIISSIAFFISFQKRTLPNINWINICAKSVFGILLFHCEPPFFTFYSNYFNDIYKKFDSWHVLALWGGGLLTVMVIAIVIDQIRLYSFYKFVNIQKNKKYI